MIWLKGCRVGTAVAVAIAVVAFAADGTPATAQISDGFYYLQQDKPRRKKRPPAQKPLDPNATIPPGAPPPAATTGTPPAAPSAATTGAPQAAPSPAPSPPAANVEAPRAAPTAAPAADSAAKPTAAPPASAAPESDPVRQRAPEPAPKQPAPASAKESPSKTTPAPERAAGAVADPPKLEEVVDALTGPDDAKFEALLNPPPRAGEKPVGSDVETGSAPAAFSNDEPPSAGQAPGTDGPATPEPASQGSRTVVGVTAVPGNIRGELNEHLAIEDRAIELFDAGRLAEAETEAKRLPSLRAGNAPGSSPSTATLNLLGAILQAQGRLDEAEKHYRRALGIELSAGGRLASDQPLWLDQNEARSLARLASVASARGEAPQADRLFGRALRISTRYEHPATVNLLSEYARHEWSNGQLEKAEDLFRRSIALSKRLSDWIPPGDTVFALNSLARIKHAQGDLDASLAAFREAKNVPQVSALAAPGARDAYAFDDFLAVAYERATRAPGEREALSAEAFDSAQRAKFGEAAAALSLMAARQAQKSGPLADLARQYQDLTQKRGSYDRQLATLLRSEAPDKAAVTQTRRSLSDTSSAIGELEQLFVTDFPTYAALANPQPSPLAETQALLASNEAMIVVALAGRNSFAWALTRSSADWRALSLSSEEIAETVEALRCGLDYTAWREAGEKRCQTLLGVSHTYADLTAADSARRKPLPFDLARANKLYNAVLGPFDSQLRNKQLIIVPDGALARLPLSVLVAEKPPAAIPPSSAGYREAAWLGGRQAITMLPSVSSLRALRLTSRPEPAPEAYLGIGDPALAGTPRCPKIAVPATCPQPGGNTAGLTASLARVANVAVTSLASMFRSGLANVDAVRALCPLPDTAHELKCVAQSLDAPAGRILTGQAATETALKHAPLDRYRVVHFATHGLLAGQTKQLAATGAEPALVLTPPAQASAEDDGLLTTSEISELKLNADWVIMSACNTAAAAGVESNEPLSGLARAFFYAGARTLLVSHWEVNSEAAVKLTTRTLADMRSNPALGRANALRLSMAALIADGAPYEAHPSYWAPFVIVGEGGAR